MSGWRGTRYSEVRRTLCVGLFCLLVLVPALSAQQPGCGAAPVPPQVLDAHKVAVSNSNEMSRSQL